MCIAIYTYSGTDESVELLASEKLALLFLDGGLISSDPVMNVNEISDIQYKVCQPSAVVSSIN